MPVSATIDGESATAKVTDPGFKGSGPDLKAAADAFRREVPGLSRMTGFGLCDGATALALYGDEAGLDGLILANPWLVEAEEGAPAPAAIRAHYRKRLLSWSGLKRLLSGAVNFRKLGGGLRKLFSRRKPESLSNDVALALLRHRIPAEMILCTGDNTAIAADAEVRAWTDPDLIRATQLIETQLAHVRPPGRRCDAADDGGDRAAGTRGARSGLLKRRRRRFEIRLGQEFSASSAAMQPVPAAVTAWR